MFGRLLDTPHKSKAMSTFVSHKTKKSLNQHCAVQLALEALESGLSPQAASMVSELVASQQGRPPPGRRRAFVPSPAQLKALPLQYGQNTIDFTFAGQRLRAYIHYFNWNSRYINKAPRTIDDAKTSVFFLFDRYV
jgi:hypothetical protein